MARLAYDRRSIIGRLRRQVGAVRPGALQSAAAVAAGFDDPDLAGPIGVQGLARHCVTVTASRSASDCEVIRRAVRPRPFVLQSHPHPSMLLHIYEL